MRLRHHRHHLLTNFQMGHYRLHYYPVMGLQMAYFPYLQGQQHYRHTHHQTPRSRQDFVVHYHRHHHRQLML
jgi:hypothetical protein